MVNLRTKITDDEISRNGENGLMFSANRDTVAKENFKNLKFTDNQIRKQLNKMKY